MTKFISIDDTKEEKKETVFTHYLYGRGGWEKATTQPKEFTKVLYLGKCKVDGDMFAIYESDLIDIYKGTKGDEFNN